MLLLLLLLHIVRISSGVLHILFFVYIFFFIICAHKILYAEWMRRKGRWKKKDNCMTKTATKFQAHKFRLANRDSKTVIEEVTTGLTRMKKVWRTDKERRSKTNMFTDKFSSEKRNFWRKTDFGLYIWPFRHCHSFCRRMYDRY